jgi:hypothetical protein
MSDGVRAHRGARIRRIFYLATGVPAVAFLACALLVDAMSLPDQSACRLWPRHRPHYYTHGFWLVRTDGELRLVPEDQLGFANRVDRAGFGRFYCRTTLDDCFWAPLSQTLQAEISASLDDGTPLTKADLESIGRDIADLRERTGPQDRASELLRMGGGSESSPLFGGWVHDSVAAAAFALIACGVVRGIRSEFRNALERRRLGRGECPYCGYSRAGSPPGPCSECGRQ